MTSIMHSLIFQILLYAVQLAVVILLGAACDFIIKKSGQTKLSTYIWYAQQVVQAAEQMLGAGKGADKKQMVVDWLTKAFGKKLSADEIEKLIESAVYELNAVIKNKIGSTTTTTNATTPTVTAASTAATMVDNPATTVT